MKRNVVVAGLFGLLLALGWLASAGEAMAQPVPGGSYLNSCNNVQVRRGRDLTAFCATRRGNWVQTRLNDFPSCRGDISNQDGQLWCVRGRPLPPPPAPGPQPLPPGSYQRSCRNAFVGPDNVLRAQCRAGGHVWIPAAVNLRYCWGARDIANFNGQLTCTR
ncbi:CVNH domain-containing protein [Xanthobacter versatilis]|uniref:CVNH domain-containing protein n=1 Tax=Xanthobacter autotrophicus (strain ATCC BAA-1158 / Py2) TaxID=78245 RepID=UPI003728D0D8